MFKNYVFDLYGTLLDIETNEEKADLWDKIAIMYRYKQADYTGKELKEKYIKFVAEEKAEVRKRHPEFAHIDIKIEKVFVRLFSEKGVTVDDSYVKTIATAFRCYSTVMIEIFDKVKETLTALKKQGKKIYLLSNAQRIFTENELNMFGLMPCFDGILISSDYECSKPDVHYYDALVENFNLKKSETLMIGNDSTSDIEGAKNAGLSALYIPDRWMTDHRKGKKLADFSILDGDFTKILELTVK